MKLSEFWHWDNVPMILLRGLVAELLAFLIVSYVPKAKDQHFLLFVPVVLTIMHLVVWCVRRFTRRYRRDQPPAKQPPA